MLRASLLLLAAGLSGCAQPQVARGGGGIVSVNPCTDAILMRLVPHARITAISHYSQDAAATSIPLDLANRFRATAGTAEEVVALAPDLVLASSFTPAATREAYRRAGLRTLFLDVPATIEQSEAQVREVAAAVGQVARGEALVADMARAAAGHRPAGPAPAALLFITGDLVTGGGTLLDDMMHHAGLRNAAADYGLSYTGTLPAELLVARPPAVIIAPDKGRSSGLRARLLPETRTASFDRMLVNCGGPTIIPAMARLRAIRAGLS
ncbi:iron complex transport system substrate-binding protein [Sphingomonas gellani]|uniref:Iron complex transport system substrate-binding protein n=1 Tax=Sphingomonas gellani TaxID=1166340 RepID=A0A1H8BAE3_9SPHN|nr:ABC transporter substrate-binding protein [Sphingomonas gellani]SEM79399.1 iron complex transport system substrate-binding protein [Sphingomonas gellani]